MLKWIVSLVLGPVVSLGEKYLDNQRDKEALMHGTDRIAIQADAEFRAVKIGSWLGALPLFVAEFSVAVYIGAIMLDSTFPMQSLTPLELPNWFKPHFGVIVTSLFGVSAVRYAAKVWNK